MEKMTYGSLEMLPQPASRIVFGTTVMAAGENADALLPDLQKKVVTEIRTCKGLNPEPYDDKYYSGM